MTKINIYEDRFLIASTAETLLMGDLETCKLSEVPWSGSGAEKYHFDNPQVGASLRLHAPSCLSLSHLSLTLFAPPCRTLRPQVCMIFNSGELTLIEYGRNEILGSCRTEHMSPHLISVRLSESKDHNVAPDVKKVAYLLDLQTVRVTDLVTGITEATVTHEAKVDWMEMNGRATKLLFRDKRRALHLYDIATQQRSTLLSFSSYVQWVPNSDVVVAQNRGNLCVWYHIEAPEKVTRVHNQKRSPATSHPLSPSLTLSHPLSPSLTLFSPPPACPR